MSAKRPPNPHQPCTIQADTIQLATHPPQTLPGPPQCCPNPKPWPSRLATMMIADCTGWKRDEAGPQAAKQRSNQTAKQARGSETAQAHRLAAKAEHARQSPGPPDKCSPEAHPLGEKGQAGSRQTRQRQRPREKPKHNTACGQPAPNTPRKPRRGPGGCRQMKRPKEPAAPPPKAKATAPAGQRGASQKRASPSAARPQAQEGQCTTNAAGKPPHNVSPGGVAKPTGETQLVLACLALAQDHAHRGQPP